VAWLTTWRDRLSDSWWGRILAEHDTEPAELSGGALKIALGFWLLLPWQTFTSSPTFESLAVVPEWIWGGVLVCVGVMHLAALRDGYRVWRRGACLVGFLVWFSMACTFVIANPPAMGWLLFMLSALQQGWCYIRLRAAP
jgi:hypothetical protein